VEIFKLETFVRHLNSRFLIKRDQSDHVEVELIEAEDLKSTPRLEQFSIIFRGPLDPPLPQATYEFEHAEMGDMHLFIVPIRRDQDGMYYEAIFNLPI